MLSDFHIRTCTECHSDFTAPRTPGRPPSRCSTKCQAVAADRHRADYFRRRFARQDADVIAA